MSKFVPFTYSREAARQQLTDVLADFKADDELHEEQRSIQWALADPRWPRTEEEYDGFCREVLNWIPGKEDPLAPPPVEAP